MNVHTNTAVWVAVPAGWIVIVPLALRAAGTVGLPAPGRFDIPARWLVVGWFGGAIAWAAMAGIGVDPLGVGDLLVLLTAVHFTFAGAGLTALLVAAGARRTVWVHQCAMVIVATGLSGLPGTQVLQPIGTGLLIAAMSTYSWLVWTRSLRDQRGWRSAMLAVSSVAWCYPMLLAITWALAEAGAMTISRTFERMIAHHGAVNAIGVVFFGLLGHRHRIVQPKKETPYAHHLAAVC
jgi:hypothetical protein